MVERLTKDLKARARSRFSIRTTPSAAPGLPAYQKALEKRRMKLVAEGTYERNTVAVKAALLNIRKGEPEAVIMVGPYKPCAEFIKLARRVKLDAVFVNISFVGSNALAKELGAGRRGRVVITQVVPFPRTTILPLVAALSGRAEGGEPECRNPASSRSKAIWSGVWSSPRSRRLTASRSRKALLATIMNGASISAA